jgi:uroporphyrin-III C-methyltransferase
VAGKVYLVGAGPGDPELLTLKALKLLRRADVVLHDDLIGPEVLKLVSATAKVQNVGKRCGCHGVTQEEINALLVNYALLDLQVVRLKGGDPLIFGRAGEEIEALRRAQIEFEVVPGVTAVLGAAAATQIPLTHRRMSSALLIIPNHSAKDPTSNSNDYWPAHLPQNVTVVIYMPGHQREETARKLLGAGLAADTPCAIISHATSQDQQVHRTTIQDLPSAPKLPAPTLLVVGEVARFAVQPKTRGGRWTDDLISLATEAEFVIQESLHEEEFAE